ncbi:uncharacterized protein [Nicotiana tomentosiformis]|uniref:uncharacterized protein n=1 Tax=Nicotiana tomentosiformis TaxID=4098 RepID=UPI00388C7AF3
MVRTRATRQDGQPPVPPARATRGRGHGRGRNSGRGVARTTTRATPANPPVALAQKLVLEVDEPVGLAQAPAVPIVIPGFQEVLAEILIVCTSLDQAVSVWTVPTISQAGGGTQTPAAHTPEQVIQGLQTPWVLPAQPVAVSQAQVGPVMSKDEQKRLERFGRLQPLSFSGAESDDAQDFLDRYQRTLHTAYERSRLVGATPLSCNEFSVLFLEKFMPPTRRKELHRQFEQLCQDGLSVTQYEMRFSELARHTVWLVPTKRDRIKRFIDGITYQLYFAMTQESVSGARFDVVVDIAPRLEMVRS